MFWDRENRNSPNETIPGIMNFANAIMLLRGTIVVVVVVAVVLTFTL